MAFRHGADTERSRDRFISLANRQDGAFAIMFAPLLIVIIGFCGLAIDVGLLYNRTVDLQGMAREVAISAAHELNGTPAGVVAAKDAARQTAERLKYQYFGTGRAFTWSDDVLSFSTSPSRTGTWIPASSLGAGSVAAASGLYFAKVDSNGLDQEITTVETSFIRIISSNLSSIHIQESAVAGRTSLNVTPIGVCAMSTDKAAERKATATDGTTLSELVQYGFRRGVSYDLMQLNPNGSTPARFAINPAAAPGTSGSAFSVSILAPFMCTGNMWVPWLAGGNIRVSPLPSTSPLASLYIPLNSRFNTYVNGSCEPVVSPPDANIKEYAYDQTNGVKWMNPATGKPVALTTTVRSKLETVADLPDNYPTPPSSPGDYGPLWAYARAVRAPSPIDLAEPTGGYTAFDASVWATLYKSGPAKQANYPSIPGTPYQATSTINGFFLAPTVASGAVATRSRRVLNIPLFSCSPAAPAGANAPATVLAIAKFFMTVPATEENLIAEFSGLVAEQSLTGEVRLYP
jgi:Flp pilus assembly protein TadG